MSIKLKESNKYLRHVLFAVFVSFLRLGLFWWVLLKKVSQIKLAPPPPVKSSPVWKVANNSKTSFKNVSGLELGSYIEANVKDLSSVLQFYLFILFHL